MSGWKNISAGGTISSGRISRQPPQRQANKPSFSRPRFSTIVYVPEASQEFRLQCLWFFRDDQKLPAQQRPKPRQSKIKINEKGRRLPTVRHRVREELLPDSDDLQSF